MNISEEIRQRLKFDQVVARAVLRYLTTTYSETFEALGEKLGTNSEQVVNWFLEQTEISREDCWKILELGGESLVPLEWMIRGDVLKEYDPELIVLLGRELIRLANARFNEEATAEKPGKKELSLIVPRGSLTLYQIGSFPGSFRMGVKISHLRDQLRLYTFRLDENEAQIGGEVSLFLPLIAESLSTDNLVFYDRHADHSYNYRDYLELIHIVREGSVVGNDYFLECHLRSLPIPN